MLLVFLSKYLVIPGYNGQMSTYAYIDAANLFYGGKHSLGWSIDYLKLYEYLKQKYQTKKTYFFGGVETLPFQLS